MGSYTEFRRGWKVLVAALLGVACGASPVPFNALGFFIEPLHQEFGWSYRDISLSITIFGITAALLAPFYGGLADRVGVRRVALWSLAAFGLVFASLGATPGTMVGFYALWLLLGLIGIGSTAVVWSRGVNLWFFERRGLALGMVLMGTSLAALVVPGLTVWGINQLGWRLTFPLLALLPLALAWPVAWWLFREPRPEERPAQISAAGSTALTGATLGEALGQPRFWLLFTSVILVSVAYGGAHVHMAPILAGHGYDTGQAAQLVGALGLAILVGRLLTGFLLDRFWAPLVTLPMLSLPAVSCVLLAGDGLSWPLAVVSVALLGLAAGAETDLIAYLAGRYFGMAHYGRIYGMLYLPFGIGSGISPAVYGAVRDSTGNYDLALTTAAVLFVVGAVLLLGMGRYPDLASR